MNELSEELLHSVIKKRPELSHKGTFGRVVLIGGNERYGGAIIMSAEAAVNSGAGLVTVVTAEKNHAPLHARLPEVMVIDWLQIQDIQAVLAESDVILIGPGLGLSEHSHTLLQLVIQEQQAKHWLVIDGSGITLFAQYHYQLAYPQQAVFTPHQMEWQRLSGLTIPNQTIKNNQTAQKILGSNLVLKSHRTTIYTLNDYFVNPLGNPAMATGGMGDTLAGMIAGFLAQFDAKKDALCAAVYLHSLIGDVLGQDHYVVLPTEISKQIPYYMKRFEQ
ncbi:NAD(P)H-hydrate dehydratase [Enterococcus sp. DIV0242_7C1]|uniref:ADP-dependent (S)-NAD(P)H-hydrate dehydratase n=1 Tax=Candidatus Enterococcus dunnyi TaxID=1834192 RepID=A0A200J6I1_9ENTE|nr:MULTISPECIES: NAD(P)H-hydrate dehydratase [unclassified Enterococcus]MBO0471621.1 NAD(P)H-hydrate dehydratase [Enterococcus sp. DIV0242_7C1]OUZ32784.1 YjeF family domain-containing protein [Enterococcus sp. 9D6_DIV0238]